ncbi:glutamine amidotransferase [Candidatus Saccharibacteria bacterium]|nr:MAG: glutamine amidotransferase [Candidatus Saccharibacteria bacterium]PID99287.1 MAG: glutamine amidotransferase [Candidatus Saccharibacteria bacterium]
MSMDKPVRSSAYQLTLVHLYPKEMNIYGDTGNRLVLQKRAQWRGMAVELKHVGVGDAIPADADIIIGGGGQDAGQGIIQDDLQEKAAQLTSMAEDGVVMLMICGLYQLFGRSFTTHEGDVIQGIGLLPLETRGGDTRMIGNTIYDTPYGEVVGYENHSGITTLDDVSLAFGTVKKGDGNNGRDKTEGCRVHNVFGTYSHGPVLVKNPAFADELLRLALTHKYGAVNLSELDNSLEQAAQAVAASRPR